MNKKFDWVYYLIMPVLFALWLYTGQDGWYNILATYVSVVFALVMFFVVLASVISLAVPDTNFITAKIQDKLRARAAISKISWALSLVYSCILIWHDKFVIGSMSLIMMFVGIYIFKYIDGLKEDELAPEKEPVL